MDMPPTRYRVVEKGRRLIVIDRLRGERVESRIVDSLERRSPRRVETRDRPAPAPAPTRARRAESRRSTGSGAETASGMVLSTQRWFDDRGPRRIRVDSDGEGKLAIAAVGAALVAVLIIVLLIATGWIVLPILVFVAFQSGPRKALRSRITDWLTGLGEELD
ncbi:hypothetical protein TPR58_15875 [Sphingomonas sp. HF-S3]|uniref:Uncharacterized protein n=1 Tax=Sphingomonas rustica TaxID=3103142 RepID=A0ABV0BAQ1_9SPHN